MTKHTIAIAALLALLGCADHPPEGRYICHASTDCPSGWSCRTDGLCWTTPDSDGGVGDAHLVDAGVDAFASDAASCNAETCNGADDDCDGLVDEGVLTVGPAVTATTDDLRGAFIVPLTSGFGVLGTNAMQTTEWVLLDGSGTPRGAARPIPPDVSPAASSNPLDVYTPDGNFVFVGGLSNFYEFDAEMLFARPGPLGITPMGTTATVSRTAEVTSTRATVFSLYTDGTLSSVHRLRIDLSHSPPTILDDHLIADVGRFTFGVLHTDAADYVGWISTTDEWMLTSVPTGDAVPTPTTLGVLASGLTGVPNGLDLAIRDPHSAVSVTNPIGAALGLQDPGGLAFAEVTTTSPFAVSPTTTIAGTTGPYRAWFPGRAFALMSIATADSPNRHWLLLSGDHDPSGSTVMRAQLREIVGNGPTIREIPIPDEMFADRTAIDFARSGATIRMTERANGTGLVTRSIGCE